MANKPQASETRTYTRFDLLQRIQHIIFLISFSLLGLTGLPQKYPLTPFSIWYFDLVGGVEVSRLIHHISAIVMMIISIVHVLDVAYRVLVLRTPINMIPWIDDLQHVIHDVQYYLGLKKHKAYYGRYSYAEKMEYLALIWGTIVMGLTGFMMWNPISTLRFLPGEAVPAAKAAHGGEALLAVLAIIVWHFYHVHIKTLNKSMFTGKITREEMEHEHPAELAMIESSKHHEPIPAAVIKKRQKIYTPIAIAILVVFSYGFYYFVGYETTAVTEPVLGETAEIFVRQTATPTLTPMPTLTSTPTLPPTETPLSTATTVASASEESSATPEAVVASGPTWDGQIAPLLAGKCLTCHGSLASGGLNLSTYA
ncbi:MAG TPA: cytochrome b/b6 domain-containing protein, partial [Anaerolineales bacterium]|nr:cytochrome b/b6 domain-containing protein [Anaerolineales bacterium]